MSSTAETDLRDATVLERPKTTILRLRCRPFPAQAAALDALYQRKRRILLRCGRRWGKSKLAAVVIARAATSYGYHRGWVVTPSYLLGDEIWSHLFDIVPPAAFSRSPKRTFPKALWFKPWNCRVEFRSSEQKGELRGAGLDFVVADEASRIPDAKWNPVMPSLIDSGGWLMGITSPRGASGWFYNMWREGEDGSDPMYYLHHANSYENPYVNPAEIDLIARGLPEAIRRQEIEAEWAEDAGAVFRRIEACATGQWLSESERGHRYVIGCDLGRLVDWTVIYVMDVASRSVVWGDRFREVDWAIQRRRVAGAARMWKAPVWLDASGIGDVVLSNLREDGVAVVPIKTGVPAEKQKLVFDLATSMEQGSVSYPLGPAPLSEFLSGEILAGELRSFGYQIRGEHVSYGAEPGYHDDCVVALGLALQGAQRQPSGAGQVAGALGADRATAGNYSGRVFSGR